MKFVPEKIASLTLPEGKSDHLEWDDNLPGFGIRLRAGGRRSWLIQYRVHGRQRRSTIGDARKVKLKAARAEAEKRFAEITLGRDPQADREQARAKASVIVGPLFEKYLALKQGRVRQNTLIADTRYLTAYWKPFHRLPVEFLTRRMIAARLNEIIAERGVIGAARARQSLSAFFTWAIKEGLVDANPTIGTNNPAAGMKSRDRVLAPEELRAIWRACRDNDAGRILKLLAFTACRRDEICGLKWSEIDLETGVLMIPGSRTKNHHSHKLTLPAPAVAILRSTPPKSGREYVFGTSGQHFARWGWEKLHLDKRILENGDHVAPWHLHDIRRSVATGMAEMGIQPHIIEAILNHRGGHKSGVAGIYNRATYEAEIKRALALWADHLLTIVEGAAPKLIPFKAVAV